MQELQEDHYFELDLNTPFSQELIYSEFRPDLIICCNVFEHIWDIDSAVIHLKNLATANTLIWITVPTCNFPHGSPDYFSAGYTPELVENLGKKHNLNVQASRIIGSKREYLFNHLLTLWPTAWQINHPILCYIGYEGNYLRKLLRQIISLPARLILSLSSKKVVNTLRYAGEAWILLRKP